MRGERLGEHDMVMGILSEGNWRKHLSVELKVRRLWSQAGRKQVREDQRDECCDKLVWWQNVRRKYGGRLVVMACFTEKKEDAFDDL